MGDFFSGLVLLVLSGLLLFFCFAGAMGNVIAGGWPIIITIAAIFAWAALVGGAS